VKTILCIFALLVLTASTADAYVRRHPVASGAAVAAGTAPVAATGWGLGQPYGGGYATGPGYHCRMDCDNYIKNLRASGYDPKKDYANGLMRVNITP
jgi:hypothetical protein